MLLAGEEDEELRREGLSFLIGAARAGSPVALVNLGMLYINGQFGVAEEVALSFAALLFAAAAARGDERGLENLKAVAGSGRLPQNWRDTANAFAEKLGLPRLEE